MASKPYSPDHGRTAPTRPFGPPSPPGGEGKFFSPSPAGGRGGQGGEGYPNLRLIVSLGFLVFIVLAVSHAALASGPKPPAKNKTIASGDIPVIVTARSLLANNKTKVVTYKKDVVVKKGDITLTADKVVIRLKKDKSPAKGKAASGKQAGDVFQGSGKIDTITAEGDVKIVQQDKTATSDKATYYSATDSFVLTGRPRVWQGDNVLTGTEISYDIKSDTFQVEDAKTVLYQQGAQPGLPGQSGGNVKTARKKPVIPAGSKPGLPKSSRGINIP